MVILDLILMGAQDLVCNVHAVELIEKIAPSAIKFNIYVSGKAVHWIPSQIELICALSRMC